MIPHALHCARSGYKRVVILSNDTDVLVVSLYYWSLLRNNGLQECWIRVGVANTTRYIPIHTLADKVGQLVQFLPAIHALTGTDITSKFGTNASALKIEPEKYLIHFGKNPDHLEINSLA